MRQWLRLMGSHCHLISPDLSTASTIVKMQIQILMQIRQKYNPTTNAALRGSEGRKGRRTQTLGQSRPEGLPTRCRVEAQRAPRLLVINKVEEQCSMGRIERRHGASKSGRVT